MRQLGARYAAVLNVSADDVIASLESLQATASVTGPPTTTTVTESHVL